MNAIRKLAIPVVVLGVIFIGLSQIIAYADKQQEKRDVETAEEIIAGTVAESTDGDTFSVSTIEYNGNTYTCFTTYRMMGCAKE